MYGKDYDYANSRLHGTIVRLGKEPVYVHSVDNDGTCGVTKLSGDDAQRVALDKLNLQPVPLGYVNRGAVCGFLTRIPKRQDWRQGLRKNNCTILQGGGMSYNNICGENLRKTIVGVYPSFAKCMRHIDEREVNTIAWCRDFCVSARRKVNYKGMFHVGHVRDNNEIVLLDEYKYLQEKLEATL